MVVFEQTAPTLLIWLGVGAAVVLCAASYAWFVPKNLRTAALGALGALFLCALLWCLFLPGLRSVLTETRKPRFIVLADTSDSMRQAPEAAVSNRWSTAREILRQPWTQIVAAECEVDTYTFASEVSAAGDLTNLYARPPDGASTLLRDALARVASRYAGVNVAGCLLLSDGIDTREVFDDWAAMARPFPIFTVLLEPEDAWEVEPDVRIDTVSTPRRVTRGWQTELKAVVSGQGTGSRALTVALYRNGALQQEFPTTIASDGGAREALFELDHPEVGIFTYRVAVPPLPGESNTNDNTYAVSVQVITSRNHLLYVEGPPRWESKYLTRVLRTQREMMPLVFLRGPGGRFMTIGQRGDMTPEMEPAQLAFFKIVILGNLDAEELGDARAANLVRFVDAGGSLILLGGSKAWGAQGFAGTPLRALLPVKAHGQAIREGEFPVALTDAGRSHPAFAGDPSLWDVMPPVLSLWPRVALSAGAQALVAGATPEGPQPLIVSHRYGQGKVTAIFTDSLWRWQLDPAAAANRPYARFWNQLIAWMTPEKEEREDRPLDLFADREQLFLGETIEISARRTQAETTAAAQPLTCEITGPDDRTLPFAMHPQQVMTASGKAFPGYAVTFKAERPGLHTAHARGGKGPGAVASDPISFFVKPFTPESVPRATDVAVLRAIADASGGRYFDPHDALDEALSDLRFAGIEEETAAYRSLWQHGAIIGALTLFLALAWSLRKWMNMP